MDWEKLLRRWSSDAPISTRGRSASFLDPRGLAALTGRVSVLGERYAATGSLAAAKIAPIAPARLATLYVSALDDAANELSLRPVDAGANVILIEPEDTYVFARTVDCNGLRCSAPSQVAADLLTSSGRGPAEGEELLRWMKENEGAWRNGCLYVVARSVLLDALGALGAHRDAITLVGAQAVYLRVGEADIAVAAYTTDGDLALDPQRLAEIPPLERALGEAGFNPGKAGSSVGIAITTRATQADPHTQVAVDLLVPATVAPGGGRRAARLSGHDARAARIVAGLEGALVDAEVMTIASLELK